MKVKVKHIKCEMSEKDRKLANDFIKFLQKKYPLKEEITIIFTGERFGTMTSGSRTQDSELKVLRHINALRTLQKSNEKYYNKLDKDMKWIQQDYQKRK